MEQANTKELLSSNNFKNLKITAKPNLKTLGPKLREDVPKVTSALGGVDGAEIVNTLELEGKYMVKVDGKPIELTADDILFDTELPKNIVTAEFENGSVFVDTELTRKYYQSPWHGSS